MLIDLHFVLAIEEVFEFVDDLPFHFFILSLDFLLDDLFDGVYGLGIHSGSVNKIARRHRDNDNIVHGLMEVLLGETVNLVLI